jgi:ectoine hydroxylase-related dioxygenase (phytanoyl-CoA dioxygenase family)
MNSVEGLIEEYRRNGFVKVKGLIPRSEALHFREVALAASRRLRDLSGGSRIFGQYVNVWTEDDEMRKLTLHPNVAQYAKRLSGMDLRLWHDQILIKEPGSSKATEFHQDQPYWPHLDSPDPISCWIALGDVPVESGCMTFIPGQQSRSELASQDLSDPSSLFQLAPDLVWEPRVTVPLQAGDATFHHGRCPHMATPNLSRDPRVAHVAIFVSAGTRYSGASHVVTDPLGLTAGVLLPDARFPLV